LIQLDTFHLNQTNPTRSKPNDNYLQAVSAAATLHDGPEKLCHVLNFDVWQDLLVHQDAQKAAEKDPKPADGSAQKHTTTKTK